MGSVDPSLMMISGRGGETAARMRLRMPMRVEALLNVGNDGGAKGVGLGRGFNRRR